MNGFEVKGYSTRTNVPFDGDPPNIKADDVIWCRNAVNRWIRRRAIGIPHYDHTQAYGEAVWLTVPTVALDGPNVRYVNWPAEDVRPDGPMPTEET